MRRLCAARRVGEGRAICRQEVVDALNEAIERREEGIVVKRPDSAYRLNTRNKHEGWLKIKPDYVNEVTDDEDLLIVGGYYGAGRTQLLSHFLLALANDASPENADDQSASSPISLTLFEFSKK